MGFPYSSERGTEAWNAFKTYEKKKTITSSYPDLSNAFVRERKEDAEMYVKRINKIISIVSAMEGRSESISLGSVYLFLKSRDSLLKESS